MPTFLSGMIGLDSVTVNFPGVYVSGFFYLGIASASYWALRKLWSFSTRIFRWGQSKGNSSKYLSAHTTIKRKSDRKSKQPEKTITHSAVIFGCNTKVGNAYAHYLAKNKFNLILIERSMGPINALEGKILE